jgi:chromosome segregation ATPase
MGSKVIGLRLADDLTEELEAKAAEEGLSTSEFMRKLIDQELYPGKDRSAGQAVLTEQVGNLTKQLNNHNQQLQQLNGYPKQANDLAGQLSRLTKRLDGLVDQGNALTAWAEKVRDELPAIRGDILALKGRKATANNPEPEPKEEVCSKCGKPMSEHKAPWGSLSSAATECPS